MIAPHRIKFNNYSNQDFDLVCDLAFDSDSGETSTYLSREAVASETYRGTYKRVHCYKYDDVLTPVITLIKNDFSDFSLEEQRKVMKWLTSKDTASFLSVYYDDSEAVSYEILGAFTEIETYKIGNNRTVGIQATFESISPFAFSCLKTKSLGESSTTINIKTDDSQSAVYPRITIKQNDSVDEVKSVSITNTYTDAEGTHIFTTMVNNNIKDEVIVLDGTNKVISSSRVDGRIFGDDFSWEWLPLYDGENTLTVTGNCVVTMEYREPYKVGEY